MPSSASLSRPSSNSRRKPCSARSRPRSFTPVKHRSRKDGWSAQIQCAFLAHLYITGSVAAAARSVGRSRASAYNLRAHAGAESFAQSWDAILAGPSTGSPSKGGPMRRRRRKVPDWRKLTHEELFWRAEQGLLRPIIYRGRMRSIARRPDNSALLRLLTRLDRAQKITCPEPKTGGEPKFLKPMVQCVRHSVERPDKAITP